MADWLDEVEHLDKICVQTKDCNQCKLGYCIKPDEKELRNARKSTRRFKHFTEDEVYVLKRQAIEASCNIMMTDRYESDLQVIHSNLLNEISMEIKLRSMEGWIK